MGNGPHHYATTLMQAAGGAAGADRVGERSKARCADSMRYGHSEAMPRTNALETPLLRAAHLLGHGRGAQTARQGHPDRDHCGSICAVEGNCGGVLIIRRLNSI